jgi:hypothetical protein
MKKLFVVTTAMLMLVSMFFVTGCAKQFRPAGTDWYTEVPKAEHERRFPHGHKQVPGPGGEKCVYNERTEAYFCQFDWSE